MEKIFINNSIILYYNTRVVRGRTISAIKVYDASVVVVIVTMIICYYICVRLTYYIYIMLLENLQGMVRRASMNTRSERRITWIGNRLESNLRDPKLFLKLYFC